MKTSALVPSSSACICSCWRPSPALARSCSVRSSTCVTQPRTTPSPSRCTWTRSRTGTTIPSGRRKRSSTRSGPTAWRDRSSARLQSAVAPRSSGCVNSSAHRPSSASRGRPSIRQNVPFTDSHRPSTALTTSPTGAESSAVSTWSAPRGWPGCSRRRADCRLVIRSPVLRAGTSGPDGPSAVAAPRLSASRPSGRAGHPTAECGRRRVPTSRRRRGGQAQPPPPRTQRSTSARSRLFTR